ncbi:ABC transporter ATP-binding protein [Allobranchiibius sp. CTAmp26]|uniref:ABC transporter ATP-binding protein n=1 Tax=Allobranchiibius sp. CTAmp26 TaxID=2815214 RepID=UPI001AA1427E|nr:ABC transporter ATP-binding protein [Allobranchiibius sp. CTAmp26]MBO1754316.1 ABC transporter ATP-binding protein [Allobranchiibius sp. CTAmp26]
MPAPVAPSTARAFGPALRIIGVGFRREPRPLAVAVLGSFVYGVMTVFTARVIGHLVGTIVTPAVRVHQITSAQIWTIVWELGIVVLLNAIGVVCRRVGAGMAYYNLIAHYRRQVTRQYLRLPLAWHHRHPSGQLLSNANADVEATWSIFQPLPLALGVVVMLVVGVVEMLRIDVWLALIGVLVFPTLFAVNAVFRSKMSPRATRAQQLRGEVSEVAHESIEAALVVKAMGREEQETERFAERTNELRGAAIEVGRVMGIFEPVIDAIPTFGTLAVLAVGTARVQAGDLSAADVVQVAYLFALLAFPVRSFGWVLAGLPVTLVGWTRIDNVLSAQGSMAYGDRALPADGSGALSMRAVDFSYEGGGTSDLSSKDSASVGGAQVLHGVDLDLAGGSLTAVVGPTGSGKSTLTNVALRLVDPDSGEVLVDDVRLADVRRHGIPAAATLVSQETFLFDDTVRGNVTLGGPYDDADVDRALRIAQARDFVDALTDGLDTRVGERGATLSGGQRQRIALARAVIRSPHLLVLDDATSAVDPTVEVAILDGLRAEAQRRGSRSTTLVVAYRLSTISLADTVVYVERGRVVDTGTHAELMDRCAPYARIVSAYADDAQDRADAKAAAGQDVQPVDAR